MKILVLTGTQEAEVSKILHRLNKTPGLHEEDYNISVPEALDCIKEILVS